MKRVVTERLWGLHTILPGKEWESSREQRKQAPQPGIQVIDRGSRRKPAGVTVGEPERGNLLPSLPMPPVLATTVGVNENGGLRDCVGQCRWITVG